MDAMGDASPHASNTSHSQRKVSEASVESESYQTHQLTLERMLNPGVFFQSVRETRKHNAGFQKLTPLMTLQQASRDGQINIVRQHIHAIGKDKKKLNSKDKEQTTALHYAVRYGHSAIVKLLVENGANVNVQGEYGATPLHYASRYVYKGSKSNLYSPFLDDHSQSGTITKNRTLKGIRQLFVSRKFSSGRKEEHARRKSGMTFQKSLRSLADLSRFKNLSLSKNALKSNETVQLRKLKRRETIHESLEHVECTTPLLIRDSGNKHACSNLELVRIQKEKVSEVDSLKKRRSFDYNYDESNPETPCKKPVVIIGQLTQQDHKNIKTVDAIILPELRRFSAYHESEPNTSLKLSVSLPDIADSLSNVEGQDHIDSSHLLPGYKKKESGRFKVNTLLEPPAYKKDSIVLYLLEQKANVNAKDYYGSTPLHYAAMRGNVEAAQQLLTQKNINIELRDKTLMTALHSAASSGSYEVCKLLLEHGSDVRCSDEEDMRPLHFAAMEGHFAVVQLLFEHGETKGGYTLLAKMIMDQDRDEQTALHLAVENGHKDIVRLCIEKGANVNFVKANLITPLHLACTSGQIEIVKMLVKSEADVEAKNVLQETPLHRAALFNRVHILEFLLDQGAEIDCRDKDKETPLMMAVRKNNVETVKLLMSRSADITVKDSTDKTCLYVAAEEDSFEAFRLLQENKEVKSLLEEFDKNENTPLHIAAMKGHIKITEMLLDMGACIDTKNDQNLTPLHLAAKFGQSRIVKLLLTRDVNIVNDEDDASNSPLHLAALEGHVRVVEILLECGAAVDARNAMLWTPLDCAASRGWTWCAECLLDADSLTDPVDKAKTTPLHLASKEGHVDMIKLLLSRKADIARKDKFGRNCLDWAIENNQREASMAIVDSEYWMSALRNCTVEGNKVTTPMRKLIKKLPDVAEKVFNQCIKGNGLAKEHPLYEISCTYEFLEDTFTDWGPSIFDCMDLSTQQRQQMINPISGYSYKEEKPSLLKRIGKLPLPGYVKKQSEIKRNHPLKFMVQNERTRLLCHPLVTYLLRHKWRACGRYVYYSKLLLFIIYLMCLTGYTLTVTADEHVLSCETTNDTTKCRCKPRVGNFTYPNLPNAHTKRFFNNFGRYAVLILGIISLLIEFGKLLSELHHYFKVHRAIELTSYSLSIIYVLESFSMPDGSKMELSQHSRCTNWHRSLGATTVWLSWISLVLFMRKFPKLGIYVVMFTDILKTFAQFFMVFALFIIAFGLGFHILLYEQKPIAFVTPARAILKTTMGMLGEFEYDSVFNDAYNPMPMAWIIYVAYLVINCIILMNLLVGLAVDDIKGVQETAALKRLAMQVDLTLDVEKALPLSVQRKLVKIEERILPNAVKAWSLWSFWSTAPALPSNVQSTGVEHLRKQQLEIKENVRSLRSKVKTLEVQNNRMESMLAALIKHHNISVEYPRRHDRELAYT